LPPAEEERLDGGGARLTLTVTEPWVKYAASGGTGPPPGVSSAGRGGLAPPLPLGTVTLDIAPDRAVRWSFRVGERDLGACEASLARAPHAWSDEQLLTIVERARQHAHAPRAAPATEPCWLDATRFPGLVTVDLCMIGPVYVDLARDGARLDLDAAVERLRALHVDLRAPPPLPILLAVLEATGGLPPGLLASDVLRTARVEADVIIAEVPGPLVAWSAAGAQRARQGARDAALGGRRAAPVDVRGRGRWGVASAPGEEVTREDVTDIARPVRLRAGVVEPNRIGGIARPGTRPSQLA
jgi:hypothetical protein